MSVVEIYWFFKSLKSDNGTVVSNYHLSIHSEAGEDNNIAPLTTRKRTKTFHDPIQILSLKPKVANNRTGDEGRVLGYYCDPLSSYSKFALHISSRPIKTYIREVPSTIRDYILIFHCRFEQILRFK